VRKFKLLGLAAVAVLALSAFIGVASASATTIRSGSTTGPAYGTDISSSDTLTGALASDSPQKTGVHQAELVSGSSNITCTASTFSSGLNSNGTSNPGTTSLTFTGCSTNIGGCTVNSVSSSASTSNPFGTTAVFSAGGNPDGTLTLVNPATTVSMTCFGAAVSCTYAGAQNVGGNLFNPANANAPTADTNKSTHGVLDINSTVSLSAHSGFGCLSSGTEKATYIVSPASIYITS